MAQTFWKGFLMGKSKGLKGGDNKKGGSNITGKLENLTHGSFNKLSGTPEEIQAIFGLDVGTLANLRWKKKGPKFFKVGRRVYYFLKDVEDWLRRNPVLTADCEGVWDED